MSRVGLRPMQWEDLPLLARWLGEPHVAQWWRSEPADLAAVEAKYGPCITGEDSTELFIVEALARPIGMIQRYRSADEADWWRCLAPHYDVSDAAGMDCLIGERDAIGQGFGTEMAQRMAASIFADYAVTDIVVTVQQANIGSWRILEKAGFQRRWEGELDAPDPSDQGPEYLYALGRN